MAEFTAEVFQNEFLPDGGTDVHAIVSVTCTGAGAAGEAEGDEAAEIIIVDTSGSMGARQDHRRPAGRGGRRRPDPSTARGSRSSPARRRRPRLPVPQRGRADGAHGRPAPGRPRGRPSAGSSPAAARRSGRGCGWPRQLFSTVPQATQRHAILLTDGKNQSETAEALHAGDPAGRRASSSATAAASAPTGTSTSCAASPPALLGTVDIIPDPADDGRRLRRPSCSRRWAAASPTPSCGCGRRRARRCCSSGRSRRPSRTSPPRRTEVNPLTGDYPTGAWGDETRDYHVAVRVAGQAGRRRAARRAGAARRRRRGRDARAWSRRMWSDRRHADHPDQPGGRPLHRPGRARRGDPGGPRRQGRGRRRDRHHQARPRRAAGRARPATTRPPPGCARWSTSTTPTPARCGSSAKRRQARRDGARHRVDQDDPGARSDDRHLPRAGTPRPADDYCDVCGAPIDRRRRRRRRRRGRPAGAPARGAPPRALDRHRAAGAGRQGPARTAATRTLPDALFCEDCGYDFTTGQMPRAGAGDRRTRPARSPPPGAPGGPRGRSGRLGRRGLGRSRLVRRPGRRRPVPVARDAAGRPAAGTSLLVGRTSTSRNIHPRDRLRAPTPASPAATPS